MSEKIDESELRVCIVNARLDMDEAKEQIPAEIAECTYLALCELQTARKKILIYEIVCRDYLDGVAKAKLDEALRDTEA